MPISWAGKVVSSICSIVGMREESRLHEVSKVTLNLFGSRPLIIFLPSKTELAGVLKLELITCKAKKHAS